MKRRLSVVAALCVAVLLLPSSASAAVKRFCEVSYWTEEGWSAPFLHEVTFITGRELDTATSSAVYEPSASFALVWFGEQEVVIIELPPVAFSGVDGFSGDDFKSLFVLKGAVEGSQQNAAPGRRWQLTAKNGLSKFIDPRAERASVPVAETK